MNLVRFLWQAGRVTLIVSAFTAFCALAQTNRTGVHFQFREPHQAGYRVEFPKGAHIAALRTNDWLVAVPDNEGTNQIQLGSRVVLQLQPGVELATILGQRPLQLSRTVAEQIFILQAPDPWTALRQAEEMAALPGVIASHPVARRPKQAHGVFAPTPNDPYFKFQWHLQNRDSNGIALGPDMNVRGAWPYTQGAGVLIAICDDGIEMAHPDLASRLAHTNHFNFDTGSTNGNHPTTGQKHGTAVAGLAAAEAGNARGIAGVAPQATMASLVIFPTSTTVVTDEQLMDMYQFRSNLVSVQNHSWGSVSATLRSPGLLETVGMSNAFKFGRQGAGNVMVRSGGNNRIAANTHPGLGNVNDDLYPSDPRVIAVAAVRSDGRAARYSSPGAPLLVAAPSAELFAGGGIDGSFPTLFTTDRLGTLGFNPFSFVDSDLSDYAFDSVGFTGTSGSAPQVSGLAALMLAVNPALTYRDVQQIMVLSARQFDAADPDLVTNGGGFRVSHNTGFGVPDSGVAVQMARQWVNRPPATNITISASGPLAIPDDGLHLLVTSNGITSSYEVSPSLGPFADQSTGTLPLVDVGTATDPIAIDLTGKAALIKRGGSTFSDKISRAAQGGASFAIIYNNTGGTALISMGDTDFVPIPAIMISQNDGEGLHTNLLSGNATAQIHLDKVVLAFSVTNTLLCEHVGVRVKTSHPSRSDLRITLVSPSGTRSVLQRLNNDTSAGPVDWTYYSTHHYFEPSFGMWQLEVSDLLPGQTGSLLSADLNIQGVPIKDTDHNGLDDDWEMAHFGALNNDRLGDPDGDGYTNLREEILGTDPLVAEVPFQLDLSTFNERITRLSWPSSTNYTYQIFASPTVKGIPTLLTNVPGKFPETELLINYTTATQQFLRIVRVPVTLPN